MAISDGPGWDGARNLADLGGFSLVGGGVTRHGVVYRSAAPEWLTAAGWRAAREAGLARVVDLRNTRERGRRQEHPVLDEAATAGIEVVNLPTEDPDDPAFLAACGPWLDHPASWAPNLALYPDRLARVFAELARTPSPVLVHCAGGRDRTGMVCSMLLVLAGAEESAVCASYEQGYRGAARHSGHGWSYDPDAGSWTTDAPDRQVSPEELDEEIAARLPTLREWIAATDVRGYLRDAGLTDRELDDVRALLRP
ncbi:tyrosine-protein phosphatase [Nocardioides sp.]|uniref:tyrosine-protein phosphatase n=1 Tax=Nocardioides sp. TaxID=35761 RepID=UPI003782D995